MDRKGIEYARFIKAKRAQIKKSLKKGKLSLKNLLSDNTIDDDVLNMKIIELISSLPKIGRVNAEKIMQELNISKKKRLLGIGKKQKEKFYDYFKLDE